MKAVVRNLAKPSIWKRLLALATIISMVGTGLAHQSEESPTMDEQVSLEHPWLASAADPLLVEHAILEHLQKTVPVQEFVDRLDYAEPSGLLRVMGTAAGPPQVAKVDVPADAMWLGDTGVFLARVTPDSLANLLASPQVLFVEPDTPIYFQSSEATLYSNVRSAYDGTEQRGGGTGMWFYNETSGQLESDIDNGVLATGKGITVAVLDSGIDATHPDFYAWDCADIPDEATAIQNGLQDTESGCASRVIKNFHASQLLSANTDVDGDVDLESRAIMGDGGYGHGTHVAGLVAGNARAAREVVGTDLHFGVVPEARVIGIGVGPGTGVNGNTWDFSRNQVEVPAATGWKWLGLAGLHWVLENQDAYQIRAASNAWACTCTETWESPLTILLEALYDAGVVATFPTSNSSSGVDGTSVPFAMSIGAYYVDSGTRVQYGNSGKGSFRDTTTLPSPEDWTPQAEGFRESDPAFPDILAPGVQLWSTAPLSTTTNNEDSVSVSSDPIRPEPGRILGARGQGAYMQQTGTSMATAHAAGVAALLADACPPASSLLIFRAIFVGAAEVPNYQKVTPTGNAAEKDYRLDQHEPGATIEQTGYGAIDARAAYEWLKRQLVCDVGVPPEIQAIHVTSPTGPHSGGYDFTADVLDPDGDESELQWAWSFSDGTTASNEAVTKQFGAPGPYRVDLVVTDETGAQATTSTWVFAAEAGAPPRTPNAPIAIRAEEDLVEWEVAPNEYVIEDLEIEVSGADLSTSTVHQSADGSAYGTYDDRSADGTHLSGILVDFLPPDATLTIRNVVISGSGDNSLPTHGVYVRPEAKGAISMENLVACGSTGSPLESAFRIDGANEPFDFVFGGIVQSTTEEVLEAVVGPWEAPEPRYLRGIVSCRADAGIELRYSPQTTIDGCTIFGAQEGLFVRGSPDLTVRGCRFGDNSVGLVLEGAATEGASIYDNAFVGSTSSVALSDSDPADQTWNVTATSGTNVMGRDCIAGNFWDDYAGDGRLAPDEPIYLIQSSACQPLVEEFDVRATAADAHAAGSKARDFHSDYGNACIPLPAATFAYVDSDGDGKIGLTDSVYVDADGNGEVSVGDVRLTSNVHGAAGSRVLDGHGDKGASLTGGASAADAVVWRDVDGNGVWSFGANEDVAYVSAAALDGTAALDQVSVGDIRISPSYGSRVKTDSNDVGLALQAPGQFRGFCFTEPSASLPHGPGDATPLVIPGPELPRAAFSVDTTTPLAGEGPVTFTDETADPDQGIIQYRLWDFGDGTTYNTTDAQDRTVEHEYAAGEHTARLTVVDQSGRTSWDTVPISVNTRPVAGFTADVQSLSVELDAICPAESEELLAGPGCAGDADGDPLSYKWSFTGSGSFVGGDEAPTARIVFENEDGYFDAADGGGLVEISLRVDDGDVEAVQTLEVLLEDLGNLPPVPGFSVDAPARITTQDPVVFLDQSFDDGQQGIVEWQWDFGDGNSYTTTDPASADPPPHVYTDGDADGKTYWVTLTVTDEEGLSQTSQPLGVVVYNLPPVADFQITVADPYSDGEFHGADTIRFTDLSVDSDGVITDRTWSFGDGRTRNPEAPWVDFQYLDDGEYTVTMTVRDDDGNETSVSKAIEILNTPPFVEFSWAPQAPTTQDVIQFHPGATRDLDAGGDIDPESWQWDFGDGNSSNKLEPTHQYAADGTYFVTLQVADDDGATTTKTLPIVIGNALPVGDFDVEPRRPTLTQDARFTADVQDPDGAITGFFWEFGDGESVTGQDAEVTHRYNEPGLYQVNLTVTDDDEGSVQMTRIVEVAVRPPQAMFTVAVESDLLKTGDNVTVTESSFDEDGEIVEWRWEFGDGTIWNSTDPAQSSPPPHSYVKGGEYKIKLIVEDDRGLTSFHSERVYVTNREPAAAFTFEPEVPRLGETIQFIASGTDPDGTIEAYSWEFGDGTTAAGPTAAKAYNVKGSYTVKLTAVDDEGAKSTTTRVVQLQNIGPTGVIEFHPTSPGTADTITFRAVAQDEDGRVLSHTWSFGDGTRTSGQTVTHSYADDGTYNVTVAFSDDDGAVRSHSVMVSVSNEAPLANFSYAPAKPSTADVISFEFLSQDRDGSLQDWHWDFGDGQNTTLLRPAHRFDRAGTYPVTLTVHDDDGASATAVIPVVVANVPPVADFQAEDDAAADTGKMRFRDMSSDAEGKVVVRTWDFGDGNTSTEAEPVHAYAEPGAYLVTLSVKDEDHAESQTSRLVVVENIEGYDLRSPSSERNEESPAPWTSLVLLLVAFSLLRRRRA